MKCAWKRIIFVVYKPTTSLRGIIWVGAIAVCPVFRNPSFSLTQMTQPVFLFPIVLYFGWAYAVWQSWGPRWLASSEATVIAICNYFFYCCCILNSSYLWASCTSVILVAWDYWGLRTWKRILNRGLHACRVVLCTPISWACIKIYRICLLWSEMEMCFFFFVLRLLCLSGATFPSLWFWV